MKPYRRPSTSTGLVLRYPCPLAELENILRAVDLSQVRDHVHRLQKQLALAEKILASRAKEQRARQEAEQCRLRASFVAMTLPDLERYIATGKPNCRMAKRILAEKVLASRAKEQRARQEAEQRRLRASFVAMTLLDLERYIAAGKPNCRMAKRILNERAKEEQRKAKAAQFPAITTTGLPLPCQPGADSDWWRIHGG